MLRSDHRELVNSEEKLGSVVGSGGMQANTPISCLLILKISIYSLGPPSLIAAVNKCTSDLFYVVAANSPED